MKLPTSWNDRDLLKDEPFLTEFAKRSAAAPSTRKNARLGKTKLADWDEIIVDAVIADPSCRDAFVKWATIVFETAGKEGTNCRCPLQGNLTQDRNAFLLFVKCYWLLRQEQDEGKAMLLLNAERKSRGYVYKLDALAPHFTTGNKRKSKKDNKSSECDDRQHIANNSQTSPSSRIDRIQRFPPLGNSAKISLTNTYISDGEPDCLSPSLKAVEGQASQNGKEIEWESANSCPSPGGSSTAQRGPEHFESLLNFRAPQPDSSRSSQTSSSNCTLVAPEELKETKMGIVEGLPPVLLPSTSDNATDWISTSTSSQSSADNTNDIENNLQTSEKHPTVTNDCVATLGGRHVDPEAGLETSILSTQPLKRRKLNYDIENVSSNPADTHATIWKQERTRKKPTIPVTFPGESKRPIATITLDARVPKSAPVRLASSDETSLIWQPVDIAELSDWEHSDEESDNESSDSSSVEEVAPKQPLSSQVTKPPLPDGIKPAIWAESRQALCESFNWFRSYQGGVYFTKGSAKGYLLSAFSSARDLFAHDGRFIISHGGGKSQIIRQKGSQKVVVVGDDQAQNDLSVRALLQSYECKLPVVLISDDKYQLFPYALGKFTYVVLGYYWITDAWAEREPSGNDRGYCVKHKFAFQWCDKQGTPWWSTNSDVKHVPLGMGGSINTAIHYSKMTTSTSFRTQKTTPVLIDEISPRAEVNEPTNGICYYCHGRSTKVYTRGWACLKPNCDKFWIFDANHPKLKLDYSKEFLRLREEPVLFNTLKDLRPGPPIKNVKDGITTCRAFCRGWWCPDCGCLSSREKWEFWHCTNCGQTYRVDGRPRHPKEFWYQECNLDFISHFIHEGSGISHRIRCLHSSEGSLEINTYILPYQRGYIHVISGHPMLNAKADEIFRLYQVEASKQPFFQRYPLRTHHLRGRMLANYFSQNSGAPYKYVAGTGNTTPFELAPTAVTSALRLIKDRAALILGRDIDFNEVLSAAYMERQKMSFHSDSEPGLGPVVSSLSLGSMAFMHFRLQSAYSPLNCNRRRHLTLVLRHGDVLVMDGAAVQTIYEHTVVPKNFRIAATARCIRVDEPAHI